MACVYNDLLGTVFDIVATKDRKLLLTPLLEFMEDYIVYYCWPITDVFTQGSWLDLQSIDDPELQELTSTLPLMVVQGKAPATITKYSRAYSRWKRWAPNRQDVPALPAKPIHVALYLSYLAQTAQTAAPLTEAVSALSWVHCMATVEDVTAHPLVIQVLAGAKRMLAHKVSKKEPIKPKHLLALVQKFGSKDATLMDI